MQRGGLCLAALPLIVLVGLPCIGADNTLVNPGVIAALSDVRRVKLTITENQEKEMGSIVEEIRHAVVDSGVSVVDGTGNGFDAEISVTVSGESVSAEYHTSGGFNVSYRDVYSGANASLDAECRRNGQLIIRRAFRKYRRPPDTLGQEIHKGDMGKELLSSLVSRFRWFQMELFPSDVSPTSARVTPAWFPMLAEFGDRRALDPLLASLVSRDWSEREFAARSLGALGDSGAVPPLIIALEDTNPSVRQAAAGALADLGDTRTIEPLVKALQDTNYVVRIEVARALGDMGAVCARDQKDSPQYLLVLDSLVGTVGDEPGLVPRAAADELVKLNDARAVGLLIKRLGDHESVWGWIEAASVLPKLGEAVFVEPLVSSIGDSNSDLRKTAFDKLGKMSSVRGLSIVRSLCVSDPDTRCAAALALSSLGSEHVFDLLIKAVRNKDLNVAETAIAALSILGDPRAVEPLIELMGDDNYGSRWHSAAARALGSLKDPRAVDVLIEALCGDPMVSRDAAISLGQLGDLRAVEPLIRAMECGSKSLFGSTHYAAAEALGALGDSRALEALIKALEYPEELFRPGVRSTAASALSRLRVDVGTAKALMESESEGRVCAGVAMVMNQRGLQSAEIKDLYNKSLRDALANLVKRVIDSDTEQWDLDTTWLKVMSGRQESWLPEQWEYWLVNIGLSSEKFKSASGSSAYLQ